MTAQIDFAAALEFVLHWEGGYSNDHNDSGGETLFGVSRRAHPELLDRMLAKWRAKDEAGAKALAAEAYAKDYWQPLQCHSMPPIVALAVFDAGVNCGVDRSAKLLQEAANRVGKCGLAVDGKIGPKTLAAVKEIEPLMLFDALILARIGFYLELARDRSKSTFLHGWIRRAHDLVGETPE